MLRPELPQQAPVMEALSLFCHPKLGTQPHAGYQPASSVSFAYHCLFWRLLGSQSPPEGDL